ncbi:hypothetical protein NQ318_007692 [Aromia moschata]|uniref:Deoxyhypusine monooxygenase n=1 Tax=Aromia moschata TaxID=1265417 RepID=A0AAV8XJE6_9CUCU|nr:hypothetical protein NQ318_007692 [Aromia moschata]
MKKQTVFWLNIRRYQSRTNVYWKNIKNDPVKEVAETCELALERINWLQNSTGIQEITPNNPYVTVDPAPPNGSENVEDLKATKINRFSRDTEAMFSLRNLGSIEAINALGLALKCGSALFRHEIAFVLGQLQNELSVSALKNSLENTSEDEMVRHECAEALGAIASNDCIEILKKYINDEKRVVRESCEVALDMCDYENSFDFQYANTLKILNTSQS